MKARKALSLVLNIIAVIASITGLILLKDAEEGSLIYIKYFTILTNCAIIVMGFVSIGFAIDFFINKKKEVIVPSWLFVLKLIAAVSALITFLTVVAYLQYIPAMLALKPNQTGFWENICHHYVAPLAFILGFILFDVDKKYNWKLSFLGIILLVTYMGYMIPICLINKGLVNGAPYPFMDIEVVPVWLAILFCPVFLLAGVGLSLLLWSLNRVSYLIFVGEEVSKEETKEEAEIERAQHIEVSEDDRAQVNEIIKTGYNGPRIYHISKREDKMWQVKFANGKKAIKLFNTQAEAIIFAKQLAKSQDGSIRVHSLKGKIRKAN